MTGPSPMTETMFSLLSASGEQDLERGLRARGLLIPDPESKPISPLLQAARDELTKCFSHAPGMLREIARGSYDQGSFIEAFMHSATLGAELAINEITGMLLEDTEVRVRHRDQHADVIRDAIRRKLGLPDERS